MREAAYDRAFELLDELKELGSKKKMVVCELEDAIQECYEASKGTTEDHESSESEMDESGDMGFRRRRGMRHHEMEPEYRKYGMRRNRYGRYSY